MGNRQLFIIFILSFFTVSLPCFSSGMTLAILNFENHSFFNAEAYEPLSKGLAEMMNSEMGQVEAIQIVERRRLQNMLDELKLAQSGVISSESSMQVGKLVGAKYMVFGGYMVTMDEKIRIDVRVVEVETGLTVKAGEVTGKTKQVLGLVKKLSKKMLKDLKIRMTKNEEKQLDSSTKLNLQAVVLYSQGLDLEDQRKSMDALALYKKALNMEPKFEQVKQRIQALSQETE